MEKCSQLSIGVNGPHMQVYGTQLHTLGLNVQHMFFQSGESVYDKSKHKIRCEHSLMHWKMVMFSSGDKAYSTIA